MTSEAAQQPSAAGEQPVIHIEADRNVRTEVLDAGGEPNVLKLVVARYPGSPLAWSKLAEAVFDPKAPLESYAYATVAYARTLAELRAAGWDGVGSVPWTYEANRGALRAAYVLRRAADALGLADEAARLDEFLSAADPTAVTEIEAARTAPIPIQHPAPPTEWIVIRGED